jgi:hypothetical protein
MISLLAASLALGMNQDSFALRRAPTTGETLTYRMTAEIEKEGLSYKVTADQTHKVISVDKGGWMTKISISNAMVTVGGSQFPDNHNEPVTISLDPRGELKAVVDGGGAATSEAILLQRVLQFVSPIKPVKPGEKWEFAYPGKDAEKIKYEFSKLAKLNEVQVAVIKSEVTSGKAKTGTAQFQIDVKTGVVEQVDAVVRPPDQPEIKFTLKRRR